MKKSILSLAVFIMLAGPLSADSGQTQGQAAIDLDPETYAEILCQGAGAVFEAMSERFNYRADHDPRFKDLPESQRPRLTQEQAVETVEGLIRAYRDGVKGADEHMERMTAVFNMEGALDSKVALLERVAECYRAQQGPGPPPEEEKPGPKP